MPIRLTQAVKVLLWSYGLVFICDWLGHLFLGVDLLGKGALTLSVFSQGHVWRIFTYSFFHVDGIHLVFDLLIIALIGSELESIWGVAQFFMYYWVCTMGTGFIYLILAAWAGHWGVGSAPLFGPMGGIYGLLMAYGIFFGERVLLFMMLFPMKAKHFVWVLAAIEFLTNLDGSHQNWVLWVPLSGLFVGFGYLWLRVQFLRSRGFFGWVKAFFSLRKKFSRRRSSHLKLISGADGEFEAPESHSAIRPKTWH